MDVAGEIITTYVAPTWQDVGAGILLLEYTKVHTYNVIIFFPSDSMDFGSLYP